HENSGRIIVLIEDLLFGSRVRETLRGLGWRASFVGSREELERALAEGADLFVADLQAARIDPNEAIRCAKGCGVPVLAYGPHIDAELLDSARKAGADEVVPRSAFSSRLSARIGSLTGKEADS